jgi:prolyl 4-hydroxylase
MPLDKPPRKQRTNLTVEERALLVQLTREVTAPCREVPSTGALQRLRIDRAYPGLRVANDEPPIFLCDGFLSPAECEALIAAATPRLARSSIAGKKTKSDVRTSTSCLLPHTAPESAAVLAKVRRLTAKSERCLEALQVARYERGEQYEGHFDGAQPQDASGFGFFSAGGQRVCTVLVYLNDVRKGGRTTFPLVRFACQPKRGTALIFFPGGARQCLDLT